MGVASCVRVVARVRRACSSRAFVARVRRARYVARVTSRACVARACSSRVFVACVRRAWRAGARRCGEAEAVCVCVFVGKCSEAYYLERNSAMDDSIGGS